MQPPLLPGLRGFVFHNLLFSSPTKNCVWRGTGHSSILLPTLRVSFPDPFLRLRYKTEEERHKVFTQYRRHLVLRENFHLSVCLIMPQSRRKQFHYQQNFFPENSQRWRCESVSSLKDPIDIYRLLPDKIACDTNM